MTILIGQMLGCLLVAAGIGQILVSSREIIAAAPFYAGAILGGVLKSETDALFRSRPRL